MAGSGNPPAAASKAAAIRELAETGMSGRAIAQRLQISTNHVYSSLARDRAEGRAARPAPRRRRLKAEAFDIRQVAASGGLTLRAADLAAIGLGPGSDVVVVRLETEIRLLSREEAADRLALA
ncbi:helix-turn-helix domain-containing protein [Brevundimonas viscosa]|uniref:Homeodomain-like domain-containing protein n=1 Tax=Brevundimonas viscosa TaxID=871741 RepID=A0A1I6SNZ1_9CAUL|nr:helix-turn-helix domain-containing protein [Brevundimonas viscosa]SFS78665.1 hypothetical protein SAMN05192570_2625 [Brevundimonas viscosa]